MVLIAFYTDFFYNVIIAWCLHFFISSFTLDLPWLHCRNEWNTPLCYDGSAPDNVTTNYSYWSNTTATMSSLLLDTSTGEVDYSVIPYGANVSNATTGSMKKKTPAEEYFECVVFILCSHCEIVGWLVIN